MKENKIVTRVHATQEKIELLQEMQSMINTLKSYASRINEKIDTMITADLESMAAEKDILEEMEVKIKKNHDTKRRTTGRVSGNKS